MQKIALAIVSCVCFVVASTAVQRAATPDVPPPQTLVLSGCLNDASLSLLGRSGASSPMAQARYSLREVQWGASGPLFDQWLRAHPVLTATMVRTGPSGSGGAIDGRPTELHLGTRKEPAVDLSPYVDQEIEVTGTLGPIPGAGDPGVGGATSRTNERGSTGPLEASSSPMLTVTAVRVLSNKCRK